MAGESLTDVSKWEEALSVAAGCLRREFHRCHAFEDEGDVSPNIIALRDALFAFPVPTDVLLIDAGAARAAPHPRIFLETESAEGPIWTLIAHHVADSSSGKRVIFHGTRPLADLDSYFALLAERFGLDEESDRESIRNLTFTGYWTWDSSEIVDFVPFDIRERATDYGNYLAENLLTFQGDGLIRRFKKEIDFNALYGLEKDPILPLEEWTKIDPTTACFVKLDNGKPPTIEERQVAVCDIQLIPRVPEHVRLTFRRAKDAYIFGYFRYDFFTVAVHYASLALEAAVKARWTASLPQAVTLSCGHKRKEMPFSSHTRIFDFCLKERWRLGRVLVNDEPFPSSSGKLLEWLEREKVVTKWERKGLRIGLNMRNRRSHVEHSSTDMPSSGELRFIANLINKLFHGLA